MTISRSKGARLRAQLAALLACLLMSGPGFTGWFAGDPPTDLGVVDGRLRPCPDTPNCVNSQADGARYVPALAFRGEATLAMERLRAVVAAMPRVRILEQTSSYLRAEARSRIFGFVDDVEFLLDADAGVVHVRSASRVGYSDLGVNRRRVEDIRSAFDALQARG